MNQKTVYRRLRIFLWVCIFVLSMILSVELIWNFSPMTQRSVRHIYLDSDLNLSDEQLLEMLKVEGKTWFGIKEEILRQELESYPVIRKAEVLKVFPDTLKVYLFRRKPLAVILVNSKQGISPAVFDKEGYAVQVGELRDADDLPIISGLEFESPTLGVRFPETLRSILLNLSHLRNHAPKLFALISEIEILQGEKTGNALRIFMKYQTVPVIVERTLGSEKLQRAILALDILSTQNIENIEELDARGDTVVYQEMEDV